MFTAMESRVGHSIFGQHGISHFACCRILGPTAHMEFEPDMRTATLGTRVHLVVHTKTQLQERLWLAQMQLSRQLILVEGALETGTWTLLNAKVTTNDPSRPALTLDEISNLFLRRPTLDQELKLVELCSGFGFASQGAAAAGFSNVAKVEKQANTTSALLSMGEPAIHGDVQHVLTTRRILETTGPTCPVALLCFACQPFSQFGDQKGMRDDRAGSLRGGLRTAYLIHALALVMENVAPTFRHPEVITLLDQLMVLLEWDRSQTTLDLKHQWSSTRERTWVAMTPPWMTTNLQPWQQSLETPSPTTWGCLSTTWPLAETDELMLTEDEATIFLQEHAGNFFAEDKEKLPTALHSLGNHLWPCPCGCRSAAIGAHRLQSRGISTILVRHSTTPLQARHIHPRELALALGISLPQSDLGKVTPLRHWLAQLGQCASLVWPLPTPDGSLSHMKEQAVASWLTTTAPQTPTVTNQITLQSWEDPIDGQTATITTTPGQTLKNLIEAEAKLQRRQPPQTIQADEPLPAQQVELTLTPCPPPLDQTASAITILEPLVSEVLLIQCLQPCWLFEILRLHDLPVDGHYMDDQGRTWTADTWLTQDIRLASHNPPLRLGRGPKRVDEPIHTYDPVTTSHYALWRLDLADSNGAAMGDDEAAFALRGLQMLVDDTTIFPPLVMDRGTNRLLTTTGQQVQIRTPVDAGIMIWDEGHWIALVVLYLADNQTWTVQAHGIPLSADISTWQQAVAHMLNLPVAQIRWSPSRAPLNVPDACGFDAIAFLANQVQGAWEWDPLRALYYTGDPIVDHRITNHLHNVRQFLLLHSAPTYFVELVMQIRAGFLSYIHNNVIIRHIRHGRGPTQPPLSDQELHDRQLLLLDAGYWMGQDEAAFILLQSRTFPATSRQRIEMPILWTEESDTPIFMTPWQPLVDKVHYTFALILDHWVLLEVQGPSDARPHPKLHFHHRHYPHLE